MERLELITALDPPESPARVDPPEREPFRIGLVQHRWHPDPREHQRALVDGIRTAATQGARLVCLQELTLSPYFAVIAEGHADAAARAEAIPDGPTTEFAASAAAETGCYVHASLYERAGDELGFNTAICVSPAGEVVARTRKQHIPVTAGYYEDRYFRPGDSGYPVVERQVPRSASPRAGTNGSRSWHAPTRWAAPRSSCTRPRSAPSPIIRTSTPSRSGSA